MATHNENRPVGKGIKKKYKEKLGPDGVELEDAEKKYDGDAEAGVDAQVDQLNEMPTDPTVQPKERGE